MKNILIAILLYCLPFLSHSQEPQNVIKVSAQAVHIDSSPVFRAMVSLGSYSSFPAEIVSLDAMKAQYRKVLEAKGIDWNELKENPYEFGQETLRNDKEGTLYEYNTTSVKAMKKFLETKSVGMQLLSSVSIIEINPEEAKLLCKAALTKAKERATIIAEAIGKSLGEIHEIEDLNARWGEEVETILYYDQPAAQYKYMVNVTFKLAQ